MALNLLKILEMKLGKKIMIPEVEDLIRKYCWEDYIKFNPRNHRYEVLHSSGYVFAFVDTILGKEDVLRWFRLQFKME